VIRISFEPGAEGSVAFRYSALLECVLSLHVVVAPQRHALSNDWVRRMRTVSPALRRRIAAFAFLYRWHPPDLLLSGGLDQPQEFEVELAGMTAHPPELLREEFGRPLYDHGGRHGDGTFDDPVVRQTMRDRAAGYGATSVRLAELLLADPQTFAQELAWLLTDYWAAAFECEWRRIEPELRASVAESKQLLATDGIWSILGRLPPTCRFEPSRGELWIDLPHEHSVEVSASRPLVLNPSVFVWPDLRVNCDEPWPIALVYATQRQARDARPRTPPPELVHALRALADDTRLRVLKLIAERPRTTQELAPLVSLSLPGLSKTLRRLTDAGFVKPRREGYYVVYSIVPERIGELAEAIEVFLGAPSA
jgi:DNA-binding transcriptional ArsR family regulator